MTQTPIIVVILAPLAATIIGLMVKHWYFDAQRRLIVTVLIWRSKQSRFLLKVLEEQVQGGLSIQNDRWMPAFGMARAASYIEIEVKNASKKRIDGITIVPSEMGRDVRFQIEDGEELNATEDGKKIELGNLQPQHCVKLHMWSGYDVGVRITDLKKLLRVSADEIDRVSLRFPLPPYQKYRYVRRLLGVLFVLFFLMYVWGMVLNRAG